jgi:hypothetical protein
MDAIHKICQLLGAIKEKHGSACTFAIQAYGEKVQYQTYIASSVMPSHITHEDLHSAMIRLTDFLEIEDLYAYNLKMAKQKQQDLLKQKEDIEDDLIILDKYFE